MTGWTMTHPIISADSHVTEPPDTYSAHIDPAFRDRAFPHSDSTWPWSQAMLAEHAAHLTAAQHRAILCDNVADLYRVDLPALQ
jgi:hypothetical protein